MKKWSLWRSEVCEEVPGMTSNSLPQKRSLLITMSRLVRAGRESRGNWGTKIVKEGCRCMCIIICFARTHCLHCVHVIFFRTCISCLRCMHINFFCTHLLLAMHACHCFRTYLVLEIHACSFYTYLLLSIRASVFTRTYYSQGMHAILLARTWCMD